MVTHFAGRFQGTDVSATVGMRKSFTHLITECSIR